MSDTHTPGPWKVHPEIRPDLDDDPMGIYVVEAAVYKLTPRYYAAKPETEELDAIYAENSANRRTGDVRGAGERRKRH